MKGAIRFAVRACAVAAVAAISAPALADDVMFAYKFEPGTTERYAVKLAQEVTMGEMALNNIADLEVTIKCVAAKDGKYSMELKFDKVDISMTMMGNTSTSPLGEQMTGQSIMFTADAGGDVSDVTPVGSFESWPTAQSVVKPIVVNWYPHLPNKAVAVGGTWEKMGEKDKDPTGTETTTNATFKFKEVKKEKGHDVAVVEQVLDSVMGGTATTPMGVYTVAGTGKGKGEFSFDPAKARVVRVKGKMDVNMDMTPQASGDLVKTIVTNQLERTLLE